MFFFSSRRRHTRFDCDWSSDVCSSDLRARGIHEAQHGSRFSRSLGGERTARGRCQELRLGRCRPHQRGTGRSEEHTSELQSQSNLVCRLLLEKKKKTRKKRKIVIDVEM